MSDASAAHEADAARLARAEPVRCVVLTISDTRTAETDAGGPLAERLLAEAGHRTVARALVTDDPHAVAEALDRHLAAPGVQVIVTTGGTGISGRDTTIEVVERRLTAVLPGFGELFRMLSHEQIGAAAMLSRATGGLVARPAEAGGDTFVFALPGSVAAVELAMTRLIAPQLAHLVWERGK